MCSALDVRAAVVLHTGSHTKELTMRCCKLNDEEMERIDQRMGSNRRIWLGHVPCTNYSMSDLLYNPKVAHVRR